MLNGTRTRGGGGGGGGGKKNQYQTPSSNIVELKERIINLLSKYNSDVKENIYEGSKKGAVGDTTLCPLHFPCFLVRSDLHIKWNM